MKHQDIVEGFERDGPLKDTGGLLAADGQTVGEYPPLVAGEIEED